MLTRQEDNKVKMLKNNGFYYAGDRYLHSSGIEIWCEDLKRMSDEDFSKGLKEISLKIKEYELYKTSFLNDCQEILKK